MKTVSLCVIQMYGLCFILLGVACMAGHIFDLPHLTALGSRTDMSPASGIGFITLGTSYLWALPRLINGKSQLPWKGRNW